MAKPDLVLLRIPATTEGGYPWIQTVCPALIDECLAELKNTYPTLSTRYAAQIDGSLVSCEVTNIDGHAIEVGLTMLDYLLKQGFQHLEQTFVVTEEGYCRSTVYHLSHA